MIVEACQTLPEDEVAPAVERERKVLFLKESPELQALVDRVGRQKKSGGETDSLFEKVNFNKAIARHNPETGKTHYSFSLNEETRFTETKFVLSTDRHGNLQGRYMQFEADAGWLSGLDSFPGWHAYNGMFRVYDMEGTLLVEQQMENGATIGKMRKSSITCVTQNVLTQIVYTPFGTEYQYTTVTNCFYTNNSGGNPWEEEQPNNPQDEDLGPDIIDWEEAAPEQGNGDGLPPQTTPTPCEITELLALNLDFKQKMLELKSNAYNQMYETGYLLHSPNNGNFQYEYLQGQSNSGEINFDISSDQGLHGYIHSHYQGLLPVFSGSDIKAIYDMYQAGSIYDINTFIAGVTTASGTTYILMVEDAAKFEQFGNSYLSETAFNTFEFIYRGYVERPEYTSISQQENGFLQLLKITNSGLSLFKGDSNNFNNWIKIALNSNNITINSNCN